MPKKCNTSASRVYIYMKNGIGSFVQSHHIRIRFYKLINLKERNKMAMVKFSGLNEVELKKLEAALKEDDFVVALNEAADANAVQKVLADKGITFTAEEIEQIRVTLAKAMNPSEELSAEDLEDVAGGGTFTLVDIEWKTKKGTKITVHIPW